MHVRNINPLQEVQLIGKLADIKQEQYKLHLMMGALTDLLIEKGLLSALELQEKVALLDLYSTMEATMERTPKH
jgi:hypothetical protein